MPSEDEFFTLRKYQAKSVSIRLNEKNIAHEPWVTECVNLKVKITTFLKIYLL